MNQERNLAAENDVRNVVELHLNASVGEHSGKNGNFFSFVLQAKRLKLLLYGFFSIKGRRRNRRLDYFYERQQRGLRLSPFLRAFEGKTVLPGASDTSNLLVDGGTEQKKSDKPKNKSYGRPNESVEHSGMGMSNE